MTDVTDPRLYPALPAPQPNKTCRGIISEDRPMPIPEVLAVVEERLMLELSDEEAETHFAALIEGRLCV